MQFTKRGFEDIRFGITILSFHNIQHVPNHYIVDIEHWLLIPSTKMFCTHLNTSKLKF